MSGVKDQRRLFGHGRRSSGAGVRAAAFLAVLFITLLCTLFYNIWLDDIRRLEEAEGDWHLRISGQLSGQELVQVRGFAHVSGARLFGTEEAAALPGMGQGRALQSGESLLEVVFSPASAAPREGPLIAAALGLDPDPAGGAVRYHEQLLALYLVRAPGDTAPRMLLPFYLAIVGIVCLSLVLIIHNAFAVLMNERVRMLGILSSIGAAPGQLLRALLREAMILTALPGLAGLAAGVGLAAGGFGAMLRFSRQIGIAQSAGARFGYHPALLAATLAAAYGTVLFSALLPAWKLSRLTPLAALRGRPEAAPKRRRAKRLSLMRSPEGRLAAGALRAQRRALRTGTLSLTLAFLGFVLIQGFFVLSDISTRYTYFYRYRDAWDVMAELQTAPVDPFSLAEPVRGLENVRDAAVYQRAEVTVLLPGAAQSGELQALGGIGALTGAAAENGAYPVRAELVILDDASFDSYCKAEGLPRLLDGAVVCNQVWDSLHSNFRYPAYLPFLQAGLEELPLSGAAGQTSLPLLGFAGAPPLLREEYDGHSLVAILPETLWRQLGPALGGPGGTMRLTGPPSIRLLAAEGAGRQQLDALQQALAQLLAGSGCTAETENRIAEQERNAQVLSGSRLVLGAACVYLALIGLASVFAHTMGFVRQRRREIARYESVGMTPAQLRRMFTIEALLLAGRPVFFSLLLSGLALAGMIRASYLDPAEFLAEAPVLQVLAFVLAVFLMVGLAYWLGSRKLLRASLAENLRDERQD